MRRPRVRPALLIGLALMSVFSVQADSVDLIVDGSGKSSYRQRLNAIHELNEDLTDSEVERLLDFLTRRDEEDKALPKFLVHLKNEVCNGLKEDRDMRRALATTLIRELERIPENPTWRDYAIQHLSTVQSSLTGEARTRSVELFFQATEHRGGALCGTALLALHRSVRTKEEERKLDDIALRVSADPAYHDGSRVTALQVCAVRGIEDVAPVAREILRDDKTGHLAISAIAALGIVGSEDDLSLLQAQADSRDPRRRTAARAALQRMRQRFEPKEQQARNDSREVPIP